MPKPLLSPLFPFFLLLLLAILACNGVNPAPTTVDPAVVQAAVATVEAQLDSTTPAGNPVLGNQPDLQIALTELYRQVNPTVVHIFTSLGGEVLGTGSGFIYDTQGYIVTNNHVVADGDSYEVVFSEGEHRRATLIGTDVDSDLAVIQVDSLPAGTRPALLGDSNNLQVGQIVVAIGNPFGEEGSMSLGIVSGLDRSLTSQRLATGGGTYSLPQVIQTDAPINPGNSGGPLITLQGEVIGINSAIRSDTGTNSGVGFSIPINAAKRIVPSLIATGSYQYSYLGIGVLPIPLSLDLQEALELPQLNGAYVTSVTPGSPADLGGVIAATGGGPGGDLIVSIDGQEVEEFNDLLTYLVFETEVGQTITLTVLRNGTLTDLPITLGARP